MSPCAGVLTTAPRFYKFIHMTDVQSDYPEDEDFDTILSSDIDFSGTLTFDKPFLIRGRVTGEIDARGAPFD